MVSPVSIYRRLPALTRRRRRLAVFAAFGGYPLLILGYATLVAPGHLSNLIWAPVAIVLFSLTLIGAFAIYGFGEGRMGDGRSLDERERAMTDRALVLGYRVVMTFVLLGISALGVIAATRGPLTISMAELTPLLIGAGFYGPLLPFAALAWIEPDLPSDDMA